MKKVFLLLLTASLSFPIHAKPRAAKPKLTVQTEPTREPLGQAGIFDISYGPFSGVYTLLDNGQFSAVHIVAGELAGHPFGQLPVAMPANTLAPIEWANFIDDYQKVGKYETAPQFGYHFAAEQLDVTIVGGFGKFSASQNTQKTYNSEDTRSLYRHPLSMNQLAGSYTGVIRTVGIGQTMQKVSALQVSAQGEFSVAAVDCRFTGQLQQYQQTGVYTLQASAQGSDCQFKQPLQGLLTPLAYTDSKAKLALTLDGGAKTAVLLVTQN